MQPAQYTIRFYEISGLVPSELKTASAATARRIALDALESGAAKRVVVRDATGSVVLDVPEPEYVK